MIEMPRCRFDLQMDPLQLFFSRPTNCQDILSLTGKGSIRREKVSLLLLFSSWFMRYVSRDFGKKKGNWKEKFLPGSGDIHVHAKNSKGNRGEIVSWPYVQWNMEKESKKHLCSKSANSFIRKFCIDLQFQCGYVEIAWFYSTST